jgi:hypothetical protein
LRSGIVQWKVVAVAAFGLTGAFAASGVVEAAGLLCLFAPGFRGSRTP